MSDANIAAAAPAAAPAPVEPTAPESSVEDVVDTEEAPAQPTPSKQDASSKKKYDVKVNNKSKSVELDWSNDEEVKNYLSKAMAADEKFQEAAQTRKQAEQLIQMLMNDPLSVLKHPDLGIDVKKLAEQVLNAEIEEMNKTPEQKQLEEMERKLKAYEEEKKTLEEQKRQSEIERLQMEAIQSLDEQVTQALQKTSLPKSPYVVKRIADVAIEAMNMGYDNVSIEQVMPYVEEQLQLEIKEMFGAMPDEVMEKLLGKGRLDTYRKAKVSKAKSAKATETSKSVKDTGTKPKEEPKEAKKVKFKDIFGAF